MGDMLELLLLFRTNKYVMLADIRKAFLMIKLGSLEDRNWFYFFMKEGNKLVCFRHTTIIFGFNASPFIFNFIIKHHANIFPADNCTDMFFKNSYVDNLIKTGNSIDVLSDLYTKVSKRVKKGNFNFRSWNTNCRKLKNFMIKNFKIRRAGMWAWKSFEI